MQFVKDEGGGRRGYRRYVVSVEQESKSRMWWLQEKKVYAGCGVVGGAGQVEDSGFDVGGKGRKGVIERNRQSTET